MKPFLLLSIRADEAAAVEEYESFRRGMRVGTDDLHRYQIDQEWPDLDLADWSGIILGGGPYNMSDPEELKAPAQRAAEAYIDDLLVEVIAADFAFLGACYGIGTLGRHLGLPVGREYAEPVGGIDVALTTIGDSDPIFAGVPDRFNAYVGHKEAISTADLDGPAVRLAYSAACPVQAFRVGENVYATQFHPELDLPGIITRIDVYRHSGYFRPEEAESIKATCAEVDVDHPPTILANFARRFATST